MTSQIPANAQGELQGALSSVNSLTSIIGPAIDDAALCHVYRISGAFLLSRRVIFLALRCSVR